jgi:hypothetical protein
VPHPLRSLQRVGYATVGIEIRGIPPFAKSAKDPGFPTARPQPWQRVRLSFKESRMRFVDPTKPYRKSGGMGHPGICCTFCRGQEMPRFMPPWVGNAGE